MRKKPCVVFRAFKGVFKKSFLKRDVLRTVDLAVSGDCHYRCNFCSAYLLYKDKKPYLSLSSIKKALKEALRLGAIHLNLTGGEPLSRDFDEICEIIRGFNPKVNLVSMVTNTLLLTFDKLKLLKKEGLDTLQVSLESIDPKVHDTMVGIEGSFNMVMRAIDYANALKLNICINVIVDRNNIAEINKLADLGRRKNAFIVLDTVSTVGRLKDKQGFRLNKEYEKAFEALLRNPLIRHDSSINFSLKMECPAGKERIHITAFGDVFTCPLVQVSYGNVEKESLRVIYERFAKYRHIKRESKLCKHAFDEDYYRTIIKPSEEIVSPPIFIDTLLKANEKIYKKLHSEQVIKL